MDIFHRGHLSIHNKDQLIFLNEAMLLTMSVVAHPTPSPLSLYDTLDRAFFIPFATLARALNALKYLTFNTPL
jgi:hypothetical protein